MILLPILSFSGVVTEGKKLGRTIGFPTANIRINGSNIEPATYGTSMEIDGKSYFGIGAHLANSDTFEVHIFDFSEDIYGKSITITPIFKIRDNQKFSSLDALKEQIAKDQETMLKWIEEQKNNPR